MNAAKANYFAIFEMLANATHEGIPGVICIDSGVPGPVLGITVCTHGNEPAGLAACDFLLNKFDFKSNLKVGTVYLVLNNIEATRNYFNANTKEEVESARFVDLNMNRLPEDTMSDLTNVKYEVVRARELLPIWQRFTAGLDIHSMSGKHLTMIITRGNNFDRIKPYIKGFPIKTLITNIDDVQLGKPPFVFYGEGNEGALVFGIEAGLHEHPETFTNARDSVLSFMQSLGMIEGEPYNPFEGLYEEYHVVGSIKFQSKTPDLAAMFDHLHKVPKGTPLVVENGEVTEIAEIDCQLLFPSRKRGNEKTDKDIEEEIAFISLPMRIREI